jgi:hypothetical protein
MLFEIDHPVCALRAQLLRTWVLSGALMFGWVGIAQGMPVISELYYDAPGSDDGLSFAELAGAPGTSLDGFLIEGINGSNGAVGPTIMLSGSIGGNGLFVVADQTSAGTTGVSGADLLANFDFQNGPDSVVLRFGETIIDRLGYGDFAMDEIFAGEGMSAPDVSAGQSLGRHFADLDTDDNRSDFGVFDTPTPGTANFLPIPEPGTAILFGLGLAGLGSGSRRCASRSRR